MISASNNSKGSDLAGVVEAVGAGVTGVAVGDEVIGFPTDRVGEPIAAGDLVVPIQRTYPLDEVRAAFSELEDGHIAGKIVLIP